MTTLPTYPDLERWATRKLRREAESWKPILDRYGREVVVCYDYERVHFGQRVDKPWIAFIVGGGEAIGESKTAALIALRIAHGLLFK